MISVDQYMIITKAGQTKGVQTLTDSMADRLEAQGYTLIPQANLSSVKITFGTKTN